VAEPLSTLEALEAAVASGALSQARVAQAFARVARLKSAVFGDSPQQADFKEPDNRRQTEAAALDIAARAITMPKVEGRLLPFDPHRSTCAVLVNPFPLPSNAEPPPLGTMLSQRFSNLQYFELGADPPDSLLDEVCDAARSAEQLLAAFVVKPAAWHRFGLPPRLRDWLQQLASAQPTIAACLGAPQGLEPITAAAMQICTFSDVPVSQQALVDRLLLPN
jgi:hypothetical protein